MEKKSNNGKYKDAVYENGDATNLFRVPDTVASCILKYLDPQEKFKVFHVNKGWAQTINQLELLKRQEYLKYFLWYVYGFGNAERLCKIVDDVVNKLDEDKDKDNIENIIEEDDNKDQKLNEDEKFWLWHMVLLDILNIKMSDLKLNFDEEKSKSVEAAIKNYLLTEEAVKHRNDFIDIKIKSDHPERLLWEYSRQVFPEFENVQVESGGYWDNINVNVDTAELLGRIFACFLKVSFYQMKRVEAANTDNNNQEIYEKHKKNIYHFNYYLQEQMFGRLEVCLDDGNLKYKRGKFKITSNIAAYLFETEELEAWFLRYNKDFFSFFCNPDYFILPDDGESNVEFFDFAFYLDKIKSFETRYRENPDEFWQTFYINIVKKNSYRGNSVIADITSFISQTELQNKMRPKIDEFEGYAEFMNHHYDLFNHKKLDAIDLEKKYFSPIIIRFFGQENLTENLIRSISKVIKGKNGSKRENETKINLVNDKSKNNQIVFNEINFKDVDESGKKDLTDEGIQSISKVIKGKDEVDYKGEVKINAKNNPVQNNIIVSHEINLINENKTSKDKNRADHEAEVKINVENNSVQNNLIASNEINNKINFVDGEDREDENKIGFWQHFLFGLFGILALLSLFLCFEIQSFYFLIPFVVCFAVDLYLGFKNYCHCCRSTEKNIKTHLSNNGKYISIESQSIDDNLIKLKENVEEMI